MAPSVSVFAGVVAVVAPVLGVRLAVAPSVSVFAGVVAVAAPVLEVRLAVAPSVSVFAQLQLQLQCSESGWQ